ncbi:MAG: hypothetical protein SF123_25855 [Chloroflexota bacterium]|nr:hypothetical protein [Chloroflexota bacterium]
MSDNTQREDPIRRFYDLIKPSVPTLPPLHDDDLFEKPKPGKPNAKPEWNSLGLSPSHPALQWDLFRWMLFDPRRIEALHREEYIRYAMNQTGTWLAVTLLCIPLLLLLAALSFNPLNWLNLFHLQGIMGLALLSVSFGISAGVSVISNRPFLFFIAILCGFFGGLIIGMASTLISEIMVRNAYVLGRPSWRGRLIGIGFVLSQITGFVLVAMAL